MGAMPGPETTVDTPFGQSVSFAPPSPARPVSPAGGRGPVAVGPGRPAHPFAEEPLATQ